MVKKSALLKKLSSYSALATIVIAAAPKADGQIIYTDLSPDTTIVPDAVYGLDLNGDGTIDFTMVITQASNNGSFYYVAGIYTGNSSAAAKGNGIEKDLANTNHKFAKPNSYKDTIDAADSWMSRGDFDFCTLKKFKNDGVFAGQGDKYVGLKLNISGNNYYGWVRININAKCDSLTIKDYAYNATAGVLITAGEETTGIAPVPIAAAVLEPNSPNPATTISNITYTIPVYSSVTITLYDVMGRKVEMLLDNITQSPGRHTLPVDVSNLTSGIYFYTLIVNGQIYSQKVAVTH